MPGIRPSKQKINYFLFLVFFFNFFFVFSGLALQIDLIVSFFGLKLSILHRAEYILSQKKEQITSKIHLL